MSEFILLITTSSLLELYHAGDLTLQDLPGRVLPTSLFSIHTRDQTSIYGESLPVNKMKRKISGSQKFL